MIRPVSRAGIYVPGGKASYPSSVLMTAIPAAIAGVKDIIMVHSGNVAPYDSRRGGMRSFKDIRRRRSAGDRRNGIRYTDDPEGGRDLRTGQYVCDRSEASCIRRRRDRHDRGSERDTRHRRRQRRSRIPRRGSAVAGRSTTKWRWLSSSPRTKNLRKKYPKPWNAA